MGLRKLRLFLGAALLALFCFPLSAEPFLSPRVVERVSTVIKTAELLRVEGLRGAAAERGEELLASLHRRTKQGHRPLTYGEAKQRMFSRVDSVFAGGTRGVFASYSEIFVAGTSGRGSDYRERGDLNRDGFVDDRGMNAEHVWPQSFFKKRDPMRSDLNQLMPTFIHPNSVRGRLPFDEVDPGEADYRNSAGTRRGGGAFEPPDSAKGRVARVLLYFAVRYRGYNILPTVFVESFWNSRIELFLRWNREFPPDAAERRRNNEVEAAQGNRNPFVDEPGLADRIGARALRMRPSRGNYSSL